MQVDHTKVNPDQYVNKKLLDHVFDHCVRIPGKMVVFDNPTVKIMTEWCIGTLGEPRDGDIIQEAMRGQLDEFAGDWCFLYDELHDNGSCVFWFARKSDLLSFELAWL